MLLFRPSNNNQRDGFVPLLDQSDTDDNDGFDEKGSKIIVTNFYFTYRGNNILFQTIMHIYTFVLFEVI